MRFGVLQFPGSCDERDAVLACERVGDARLVWHGDRDLSGFDALVIPGGFSYGDYLRAGAIARFAPAMEAVAEFAAGGGPVLGICNGFQVLCEAGLLPGALLPNQELRFICRQVDVEVVNAETIATAGCEPGTRLSIPVKHMSGRWFAPGGPARAAGGERPGRLPLRGGAQPERLGRRRRRGLQRARERRRADAASRARGRPPHRFGRRPPVVRVARRRQGRRRAVRRRPRGRSRAAPLLRRLVSSGRPPAPFVVGVGRSGTTLLRLMLDAHPELAIGPETQFVGDLLDLADDGANADRARRGHGRGADLGRLRTRARGRARARGRRGPRRRPARVLRPVRGGPRKAALGREDARLRAAHGADRRPARGGALRPSDPRRPRRRALAARPRDGRGQADGQDRRPVAQADRGGPDCGPRASRPVPGAPLRGPGGRSGARPAPRLRAGRARLRPGDAQLPRAAPTSGSPSSATWPRSSRARAAPAPSAPPPTR